MQILTNTSEFEWSKSENKIDTKLYENTVKYRKN